MNRRVEASGGGSTAYWPWVVAAVTVVVLALAALVGTTTDPALHVTTLVSSDIGWWIAYLSFTLVGALVATRRPDNPVGWLMLAAGVVNSVAVGATQYAVWGLVRHPGSLPGASVAAWLSSYLWTPAITILVSVLVYFPTGQLASRRWRWIPVLAWSCTALIVVVSAVDLWPRRGRVLIDTDTQVVMHSAAGQVIGVLWPFIPLCAIGGMVSIVVRYRRAIGVERQQLKWLVLAGIVSAPTIIVGEVTPSPSALNTVAQLLSSPAWFAIGIALAILRYRLYDIDRIVSRTVSYAVVTGGVVGVYVGVVALIESVLGYSSGVAVAASTLAAAAAFQPLRRRVQLAVDRRFDRTAYDARRTVEAFAARLRDEVQVDTVRHDLLSTASVAVAPSSASLWLVRT